MKPKETTNGVPIRADTALVVCVLFAVLTVVLLFKFVNLRPVVDENFFFSVDDPRFQEEKIISSKFERRETQLLIAVVGDATSPEYAEKIEKMSQELEALTGVQFVRSITRGPRDFESARRSPLWGRVLLSENDRSTNIVVTVGEPYPEGLISEIERIVSAHRDPAFHPLLSGAPYIIELIERNLTRDMIWFGLIAYVLFGLMTAVIFRSLRIVVGTIVACTTACTLTLIICDLFKIQIGLLTANLITIVFIMTLEHIIFLSFNWKRMCQNGTPGRCVGAAMRFTFTASFWSMFTTVLGFVSLFMVPAKPLRELGVAGALGTFMGLVTAYVIYPVFLRSSDPHGRISRQIERHEHALYLALSRNRIPVTVLVIGGCLAASFFIDRLDSDPSLLSYFKKSSPIYQGLSVIDSQGGSSPLVIVVKKPDGQKLVTGQAYEKLWEVQRELEQHSGVGQVLSLPVLLAEAKRSWLAFLLPIDWLVAILERPSYGAIARSFISEDRKNALFLLRMKEQRGSRKSRLVVVEELVRLTERQGFKVEFVGGAYVLQGHLSQLVASSLVFGLGRLILIFFVIAWFASRSLRIAAAMIVNLLLLPIGILGIFGFAGIPLDIVAAPASNVAIGMGIDSMLQMVNYYRKSRSQKLPPDGIWRFVQDRLWQPILTNLLIIVSGFSMFLFSQFPPTQRFGFSIVFGSVIAALAALLIMPLLIRLLDRVPLPHKT